MFKEKLIKFKESFTNKEEGNNKKTIENLVVFIIILIITIVIINYIWGGGKSSSKSTNEDTSKTKTLASSNTTTTDDTQNSDDLSVNLESILAKIKGVGEVKVLITYSQTSQTIPMYSEDSTQKTTEENDSSGGTRVVNENTSKKDIIYEESEDGVKTPVTESIINPTIEGAIITAQGASNADIKASIVQAVEAATGIATYKIQVFEMN